MNIDELRQVPDTFINPRGDKCHESLLQSFQILQKVRELLEIGTPAPVVLEIIDTARRNGADKVFCCFRKEADAGRGKESAACPECQRRVTAGIGDWVERMSNVAEEPGA